jgi:recombination protein RecR
MHKYPLSLSNLVSHFKKLPGVGTKTAERFAFEILQWPNSALEEFAKSISTLPLTVQACKECGCLSGEAQCFFCCEKRTLTRTLCVVAEPKDVYPIENTQVYQGMYHVLGGLISPLTGKRPEDLTLKKLKDRIMQQHILEVIIAVDSTLEGDATALFLKEYLKDTPCHTLRPAMGMPMGTSLDYVDGGTLARALAARQNF